MKTSKNKIYNILIIVLGILVTVFAYYKINNLCYQNNELMREIELKNVKLAMQNRIVELQSKNIWEIGLLDSISFKSIKKEFRINKYKIIFYFESMGCAKCFEFHKRQLLEQIGKNNFIIFWKNSLEYLKKEFWGFNFAKIANKNKAFEQIVLFITPSGKIIYADLPEYGLYELSAKFYENCAAFL